ncbi:MAG: Crp/Fnr family transcriptional regulator [Rhodocyclaceae bacterium]|nr:Crp/Fnr family transcriptional regulator [Rhodocyclaceae bacterium]
MREKVRQTLHAARIGAADCLFCHACELPYSKASEQPLPDFVRERVDVLHFRSRARIYAEDTAGEFVYSLRSGLVKLEQQSRSGRSRILRLAMPGCTLGLELLIGGRYRHTAQVLRTAELCRIPLSLVRDLRDTSRDFRDSLQRQMQNALDAADFQIAQLSTGSSHARIARLLLHLAPEGMPDPRRWILREDMAALLGVTLETVSRTIADMKRRGVIEEHGHTFKFRRSDLERLADN